MKRTAFHNIGLAGFITSATRAKIFDAIIQKPDSVLSIQTDGIYSTSPLELDTRDVLGAWSCEHLDKNGNHALDGIVAVQAGVYWGLTRLDREPTSEEHALWAAFLITPNADTCKAWATTNLFVYNGVCYKTKPHYRGYVKESLYPEKILHGWEYLPMTPMKSHPLLIPSRRFITLGSALVSEEMFKQWGTWRQIERELELLPIGKRQYTGNDLPAPHIHLCQTQAFYPDRDRRLHGELSHPYTLQWGRDEPDALIDGVDFTVVEYEFIDSEV